MRRSAAATAAAVALAMALTGITLPAAAQEPPAWETDLATAAERRLLKAIEQLDVAEGRLEALFELQRTLHGELGDPLIDAAREQIIATRADLTERLIGFERQRVAVAEAAAETARRAKRAIDARLHADETLDPKDRTAAKRAELRAYEAALRAVTLAAENLKNTSSEAAAEVEAALVLLSAAQEGTGRTVDPTRVHHALRDAWAHAAEQALEEATAALELATLAREKSRQERAERNRRNPTSSRQRRKPKAPRPRPRTKPHEPSLEALQQREALLRRTTEELETSTDDLTQQAAQAGEDDPDRLKRLIEALEAAQLGAAVARAHVEDLAAQIADRGGTTGPTRNRARRLHPPPMPLTPRMKRLNPPSNPHRTDRVATRVRRCWAPAPRRRPRLRTSRRRSLRTPSPPVSARLSCHPSRRRRRRRTSTASRCSHRCPRGSARPPKPASRQRRKRGSQRSLRNPKRERTG